MAWKTTTTETFLKEFKKHRKDREFVDALDKKIIRLQENPESVGGFLSGQLHGYKSTRILGKFRLIFKIVPAESVVYLVAIDHRKFDYTRFEPDRI